MKYILGYVLIQIFIGLIISILVMHEIMATDNAILTLIGFSTHQNLRECECYTDYYTDLIIFFILLYIQVHWIYKSRYY